MLQNHIGFLLSALGLEQQGGWTIVREELANVLNPDENTRGRKLYDFFVADTMPFKCFLMMRMEGKYRDVSDTIRCLWFCLTNQSASSMWKESCQILWL
jgi:siderophore synthetase component